MKRIILSILAMWCLGAAAQFPTGYTGINARYDWLAGKFRALHIPAGTDTAFAAGQYTAAGAILVDTAGSNQGVYYRMNNRWNKLGIGLAQIPLYYNGDTLTLNQADGNNDGYLSAEDHDRFDSAANMVKDTLPTLPAIIPKYNKLLMARQFLLGPAGSISYYNTSWDAAPYPTFVAVPPVQNTLIGARGAARRYLAGTLTGIRNTTLGEFAGDNLTTGSENLFLGRSSGFGNTVGYRNIGIGANTLFNATDSNTLRIGVGVTAPDLWIYGGSGIISVPSQVLADSDSTDKIATTAWVKKNAGSGGGGGITDLAPDITLTTTNFTIAEPSDHREKTYVVSTAGLVTVTAPASPTAGQIITIFLTTFGGGSVAVPTYTGTRTITTDGGYFTLQWSPDVGGYIVISEKVAAASGPAIVTVSASATLTAPAGNYDYIEVSTASGNVTLTLPSMTAGKSFAITKTSSDANTLSFTTAEGVQTITTQYSGAEVYYNGSNYKIRSIK